MRQALFLTTTRMTGRGFLQVKDYMRSRLARRKRWHQS